MTIEVSQAGFDYPSVMALEEITLTLVGGEVVALLGANGSGKTTLARLLNGLLVPTRGEVRVAGHLTAEVDTSALAAKVGYLFQNPRHQVFHDRVDDEVAFGPRNLGRDDRAAEFWLEFLDLTSQRERHPYDLGEAGLRRVALASVLALDSDFVVLDEPTASLDRGEWSLLVGVVNHLREHHKGVVVITHDLEFAAEFCQRALVLERGRLYSDGSCEEVLAGPLPAGLVPPVAARFSRRLEWPGVFVRQETFLEYWKSGSGERFSQADGEGLEGNQTGYL